MSWAEVTPDKNNDKNNDDDVFDEEEDEMSLIRRDLTRVTEKLFKVSQSLTVPSTNTRITSSLFSQAGYRDGLEVGDVSGATTASDPVSAALQDSFDRGYATGFAAAKELAALRARAAFALGFLQEGKVEGAEEEELDKLHQELVAREKELSNVLKDTTEKGSPEEWSRKIDEVCQLDALRTKLETVTEKITVKRE